jgi:NADH dehydrogenase
MMPNAPGNADPDTGEIPGPDARGDDTGIDAVTGAFSYSGQAIAGALLGAGRSVRTLTGHPERAPQATQIQAHPLDFEDPVQLCSSLEGVTTLYNTYWVRFAHHRVDHERAVANSRKLFEAARRAGVERIVHISITNPSIDSPYPYFRGKALVERSLVEMGLSYSILRPAILFGGDGVLLNNIAWLLRRLPVFAVGGGGDYRIRGIHIDDLAGLCVAKGGERGDSVTDAVGPESPTFLELVTSIRSAVGSRARIVRVPPPLVPPMARLLGLFLHDVLLTRDEYGAMASGLAATAGPATGPTALSDWLNENASVLGLHYANEIDRHFASGAR